MRSSNETNNMSRSVKFALISVLVWLLFLSALLGCQSTNKNLIEDPPSKRPRMAWDGKHEEAGLWTEYAIQAVAETKLATAAPKDFSNWCPSYNVLSVEQKNIVFALLLSRMAQFESGFRPDTTFTEGFNDSKGKPVISRGLLQISIESANGYGCGIIDARELHNPKTNLSCGAKIVERWVLRDGVFSGKLGSKWLGVGRYWSVMRSRSGSYKKIQSWLKSHEVCK